MTERMTLAERLLKFSIRPSRYTPGDYKLTCPKCSHTRRNKTDPCLSVTIDADGEHAVWNCHNCSWKGTTHELDAEERKAEREAEERKRRTRAPPKRPTRTPGLLTPAVLRWFADRGISEATVRRNRIGSARHWIPALKGEVDCIAFPYFRNGELINIKYRALSQKAFAQEKDAEQILYGLDDIAGAEEAVIVEGEIDKLSCEEAGVFNVVSVPAGAPSRLKDEVREDDARFEFLGNCEAELTRLKRIILGVDADQAGAVLEEELARRLGKERCWLTTWPDSNDAPCKDASQTLLEHGPEVLRECIAAVVPYPITGLHRMANYVDEILALYDSLTETGSPQRGLSTGWPSVDAYMTIRPGELSVVTGYTHSGKSEFLDALFVNLARLHGWRFAVCSFENPPAQHIPKLLEKYLGAPFTDGPTRRMGRSEVEQAMTGWLEQRFFLIRAGDEAPTIDWILEKARAAVLRHGVRGLVIDPYNEVEHHRDRNMTETEYVSQILGKVKRFAENHALHVWFVAHPAKPVREGGKLPVPTLYDISGSANWANKCDIGLVVYRDLDNGNIAELYLRKVRFKEIGQVGVVELQWDRVTGRYSEPSRPAVGAARAYRDD
jgi:twinkle protein